MEKALKSAIFGPKLVDGAFVVVYFPRSLPRPLWLTRIRESDR